MSMCRKQHVGRRLPPVVEGRDVLPAVEGQAQVVRRDNQEVHVEDGPHVVEQRLLLVHAEGDVLGARRPVQPGDVDVLRRIRPQAEVAEVVRLPVLEGEHPVGVLDVVDLGQLEQAVPVDENPGVEPLDDLAQGEDVVGVGVVDEDVVAALQIVHGVAAAEAQQIHPLAPSRQAGVDEDGLAVAQADFPAVFHQPAQADAAGLQGGREGVGVANHTDSSFCPLACSRSSSAQRAWLSW